MPVALHDARGPNLNFFGFRIESQLDFRDRFADRARIIQALRVDGNHRRAFGHAVALNDMHPETAEKLSDRSTQGGAPGNCKVQASAESS